MTVMVGGLYTVLLSGSWLLLRMAQKTGALG
jgi:hypothetical protein